MDAFIILHAANAYGVEPALVERAFGIADPFPLSDDFLKGCKWRETNDPNRPENNAYLTARWIASLNAQGKSPNAVLDEMARTANVPWKRPWYYRLWKLCRTLTQR